MDSLKKTVSYTLYFLSAMKKFMVVLALSFMITNHVKQKTILQIM